ncbi:mitochondrial carrier [Zopfochytrium polystomum]|nr:mitochondrial carrier [Zopfochytrium polystomum]
MPGDKRVAAVPLPTWKDFVAGSISGMAQVAIGHPLDTIKVRLQLDPTKFKGPIDCFTQTIRNEGVLGLYKGMAAPLVGIGFVNAVVFTSYGWFKMLLADPRSPDAQLSIPKIAVAGIGAGIVNSFVASPIELLKIRLQAQYTSPSAASVAGGPAVYHGPVGVARALIGTHGLRRGLMRGTWATIVREIPAYAGFYGGFEAAKRALTPEGYPAGATLPVERLMLAGSVGGVGYWTCCYPLDLVKSRIQKTNPGECSTAVFPNLRSIYAESGIRGLFNGFPVTVLRTIPAAAATFTVFELTVRVLG